MSDNQSLRYERAIVSSSVPLSENIDDDNDGGWRKVHSARVDVDG